MLNIPKWKIVVAAIVFIYSFVVLIPNFSSNDEAKKINLGLDLQGGAYLLLEIDQKAYFEEKIEILKSEVRNKLRSSQTGYLNLIREDNVIKFSLRSEDANLVNILQDLGKDIAIDQQGLEAEISYSEEFIKQQKIKLLEQSLEIVRRRIDETGTKEPLIQPQGLNRIILQVPGIKNPERLKRILGKTAKMSFHLLHPDKPIVEDIFYIPNDYKIMSSEEDVGVYYLVKAKAELSGDLLNDAQATIIQGRPQVNFSFDNLGARKFGELTSNNVGKKLVVVLDQTIISAPVIREPIIGGSGVISGDYTAETANDLALLLRAGSLPAPLNIIEERTVGPSLGQDSIMAGKRAVMVGFAFVLILMLVLYKKFGVFALLALFMNIVFIFSALTLFGATLTLPGIAGIVLTIGMAVDTNVLIFERIREEARTDKSIYAVVDQGFNQALKTIIDSNITTLIAALVLFNFGSGPVKGFAVTLAVGILASMFSAVFLTKLFIYTWVLIKKPKKITV